VDVEKVTDISENHDASIFMGKVCRVDSLLFCVCVCVCVCVGLYLKNQGSPIKLEVRGDWDGKEGKNRPY
jgi:hypothetical protein